MRSHAIMGSKFYFVLALMAPSFEPIDSISYLSVKVAFLLAITLSSRVAELQALVPDHKYGVL